MAPSPRLLVSFMAVFIISIPLNSAFAAVKCSAFPPASVRSIDLAGLDIGDLLEVDRDQYRSFAGVAAVVAALAAAVHVGFPIRLKPYGFRFGHLERLGVLRPCESNAEPGLRRPRRRLIHDRSLSSDSPGYSAEDPADAPGIKRSSLARAFSGGVPKYTSDSEPAGHRRDLRQDETDRRSPSTRKGVGAHVLRG